MGKVVTVFFILTTIVFGCLYYRATIQMREEEMAKHDAFRMVHKQETVAEAIKTAAEEDSLAAGTEPAPQTPDAFELNMLVSDLQEEVKELKAQLRKQKASANTHEVEIVEEKKGGIETMLKDGLAKMFEDPETIELMRQQHKGFLDMQYGTLFKELGLSGDDLEAFKNLLIDRQMGGAELGMSMMKGDMDKEKMKEAAEAMKEKQAKMDEDIKALLGDQGYDTYKHYEKSAAHRASLSQFKQQVAATGEPMESAQEEQLIEIISRQNADHSFSADFGNPGEMPTDFSQEKIDEYLKQRRKLDAQILEESAAILSKTQQDLYSSFLQDQQKMMELGLKMSSQFFKQPTEE